MTDRLLYRLIAGNTLGPYSPEKLRPLITDGRISRLDRFSYDGLDWQCADRFPELVGRLAEDPLKKSSTLSYCVTTELNENVLATDTCISSSCKLKESTELSSETSSLINPRQLSLRVILRIVGVSVTGIIIFVFFFNVYHRNFGSRDVTESFSDVVKSCALYSGKTLLVRGIYYPQGLQARENENDFIITFRSTGSKKILISGDRNPHLMFVVPAPMGNKLMQIVGRLESDQPVMLEFVCSTNDFAGGSRSIGYVNQITFYRDLPPTEKTPVFLTLDKNCKLDNED